MLEGGGLPARRPPHELCLACRLEARTDPATTPGTNPQTFCPVTLISHVIPLLLLQTLTSPRWNCNVFARSRKITAVNYVRNLSGPGLPPPAGAAARHRLKALPCPPAHRSAPHLWRGFCIRSLPSACRRRVAPLMVQFPPFAGGEVTPRGGDAPTHTIDPTRSEQFRMQFDWVNFQSCPQTLQFQRYECAVRHSVGGIACDIRGKLAGRESCAATHSTAHSAAGSCASGAPVAQPATCQRPGTVNTVAANNRPKPHRERSRDHAQARDETSTSNTNFPALTHQQAEKSPHNQHALPLNLRKAAPRGGLLTVMARRVRNPTSGGISSAAR